MVWFIVFICIFSVCLSRRIERHWFSPLLIFSMLWLMISLAASLSLYDMYAVNTEVYFIFFLGLVFYLIGYVSFYSQNAGVKIKNDSLVCFSSTELKYKFVYILAIIAILYFLSMASVSVVYLLQGKSLKFVRMQLFYYQESELYEGTFAYAVKTYIMQTIVDFVPIVSAVDLLAGKRDKLLAVLNIVLLTLFIIVSGGRLCILYFLVDIIAVYVVVGRKIELTKKQKRLIYLLATVAISGIFIVSFNREIDDLVKSYYVYLAGCYPYFLIFKDRLQEADFFAYGMATFRGPLQTIFAGLKLTNIIDSYPDLFMQMADYCDTSTVYYIGQNMRFNGFVSIFYYFFVDFRYLGLIIGSFFYGRISNNIFLNAKRKRSVKELAIFCSLMQSVIVSFARFEYSLVHFFLATMLIFVSYRRVKSN